MKSKKRGSYRKQPVIERLMAKVDRSGECWVWQAATARGYGYIAVNRKMQIVHRVAYELLVGPIPEGLQIDHLCRNKLCVNPDHLEPVTQAENIRRAAAAQTTCKQGHPLWERTGEGYRFCRVCKQERERKRRAARREARRAA